MPPDSAKTQSPAPARPMDIAGRGPPLVLGLLVVAAYAAHAAYFWPQVNDDAYITFRYSQNLSLGRGPYFNAGEHVEGYTNLSLMLLMAAVHRIAGGGAVALAAKIVGVVSGGAALLLSRALAARWIAREGYSRARAAWLGWSAAALVAVHSAFVVNTTTGLETALFSMLAAASLWLGMRQADDGVWRGAGIAAALLCLTRPEGAMAATLIFAGRIASGEWRAAPGRRLWAIDAALVASAVAAAGVFRALAYDGEWVPNTYFAKQDGLARYPAAEYILNYAWSHGAAVFWALALLPATLGAPSVRRDALAGVLLTVAPIAGVFSTGSDWMIGYRLLVPYFPVVAATSIAGMAVLAARGRAAPARAWRIAALLGVALPMAFAAWETEARDAYRTSVVMRVAGYAEGHVALAEWLSHEASPGDTIALMDIGIVGYGSPDLRILDITGLTDRTIAKSPGHFLEKEYDTRYVFDQKPEFIVIVLRFPLLPGGVIDFTRFAPWTAVEARLVQTPQFRESYVRPQQDGGESDPATRIAGITGAERVFRHSIPDGVSFLCAYRRHAE